MKYCTDFDIRMFEFWGNARQVYEKFDDAGKLYLLNDMIESAFEDLTPSEVDINDFVGYDEAVNSVLDEVVNSVLDEEDEE